MSQSLPPDQQLIRKITRFTLGFMIAWGFVIVLAQIRPFWVDEWRIIYNLKYKTPATIFGPLDYMQQFPRVYLWLIKVFAAPFDYSYFTLRVPAYLTGVAVIIVCYRLMNRLYPSTNTNRFLFIMILVSSFTFTEYFVQIKQYTMDILLSLLAIYQLLELLEIEKTGSINKHRYIAFCISFLLLPFFSYTYPIVIAPVFIIIFFRSIYLIRSSNKHRYTPILLRQWLPLVLCLASIAVFYIVDVRHVMADQDMKNFWGHRLMRTGFNWRSFFSCSLDVFVNVGSGLLFGIIFGIAGVSAFFFSIYKCIRSFTRRDTGTNTMILSYALTLLFIAFILLALGKFPLGEPRLSAFTVPAISIFIITMFDAMQKLSPGNKLYKALPLVIYIGVTGNIYTTVFTNFTSSIYAKSLDIYVATENAIILAQAQQLPIFVTPGVAYPNEHEPNIPSQETMPGDWVLKTFPAYKVYKHTPVYAIADISELHDRLARLPASVKAVLAGDGQSFRIIKR